MNRILINLVILSSLGASVQAVLPVQCEIEEGLFEATLYHSFKDCEKECSYRCRMTDGKGNPVEVKQSE